MKITDETRSRLTRGKGKDPQLKERLYTATYTSVMPIIKPVTERATILGTVCLQGGSPSRGMGRGVRSPTRDVSRSKILAKNGVAHHNS
jgi:hypothetical protein